MGDEDRSKAFINQFDVDLCEDITKVSAITLRFAKCKGTDSGGFRYKTFQPGQPEYGNITFEGTCHPDTFSKIQSWVKDCYNGTGKVKRKDITINLREHQQETAFRSFNLMSCFPESFNYIDVAAEGDAGVNLRWILEVRVNRITMA
jgi:phage tail-like protein